MAREDPTGSQRLVAYLVLAEKPAPPIDELRSSLRKLPDFMVPSYYVFLDELPALPNGKVDRRALPAPSGGRPELRTPFVRPRTPLEEVLAGLWAHVLGVDRVGIHDDFLELGGDSLLAASLFAQIEKTFAKKLPLAILIEASTVKRLARVLRGERWSALSSLIAIQPNGSKPPFFCVHGAGGHVLGFTALARYLGREQPFFGLEAPGRDGEQPPLKRVEALAAHYVDEILAKQPEGPCFLGGVSMGGIVAFEMAQQLRTKGQEVAAVTLLDTQCPVPTHTAERVRRRGNRIVHLARRVRHHVHNLSQLDRGEQARYIKGKARVVKGLIIPGSPVRETNIQAARTYVPKPYPGRITLFWSTEPRPAVSPDTRLRWADLATGGLEIHEVPGDHLSMMTEPHVQVLGRRLRVCLDQALTVEAS